MAPRDSAGFGTLGKHAARATRPLHWLRNRSLPVLVAVVGLLATYPIFDTPGQPTPISAMVLFVPLFGVFMLSPRRWGIIPIILALAAHLSVTAFYGAHLELALANWPGVLVLIFYIAATVVIAKEVFFGQSLIDDRVYGGVAVYLLIGVIFAILHHRLGVENPAAYRVADGTARAPDMNWADYLYFSFVCLTTVGFGDITPAGVWARNLAVVEAAVGMLYPAVLLARLVNRDSSPRRAASDGGSH